MLGIIFLLSGTPTILREVLAKLLLHAITIRGDIEADDHKKFIEIASDIMQANVINSKGGHIGAAIIIGRFIRLRNMKPKCTMRSNAFTLSRTL